MALIWISVAALVAAATILLLRKPTVRTPAPRPAGRVQPSAPRAAVAARTTTVDIPMELEPSPAPAAQPLDAALRTTPVPAERPMPAELAALRVVRADDVPADRRQAYAETFRNIPRPPKLLHHLLSADFVNASSSAQLVDLIAAEPLLAGRILTVVNSPLYGLQSPMGSIGQAVTYLGLNAVRSLCLQYILIAQFRPDGPERKKLLDVTWTTSALTSELTQQLAHRLGYDDRGSLVSAVVLSFIGRLAITAAVSRGSLDSIAHGGLLARTVAEQKVLGLAAAQIGRLLMRDWGLPARIVDDAADIDGVLVTPASGFAPDRAGRLGLCYLAARLGERLAQDEGTVLADFDPELEEGPEFFHLRGYLALPQLARMLPALRAPEVEAGVRRVRAAMRQT